MTPLKAMILLNVLIACIFIWFENMMPARKIDYKSVFWADFSATLVSNIMAIIFVLFVYQCRIWFSNVTEGFNHLYHSPVFNWLHQKPFVYQFILYLIMADFGMYWAHRFMHSKHVWRVHRWHHYPQYMYWGAGFRASIIHQALFLSVGMTATLFLPEQLPGMYFLFAATHFQIANNFMHMNVSWKSDKLEWLIVTPRFHRTHHSNHKEVHNANYGAMFSFWDRLFGSYVNPNSIKHLQFGTGEKRKHPWMFLGF